MFELDKRYLISIYFNNGSTPSAAGLLGDCRGSSLGPSIYAEQN